MQVERDPYFDRPEISNSDLSWLEDYWLPQSVVYDKQVAYRFGTLLDVMITEPDKINYFKLTCAGDQYTKKEFELAEQMKASFWKDPLCLLLAKNSNYQEVTINPDFRIEHEGMVFYLPVRCKWDLNAMLKLNMTGDIKSTTAETLKQFIAACEHFGYWRQRAWYMDIPTNKKVDKDILIGISKVNKQVFKVPIERGGEYYNRGKQQYQELAWKWHYLFGDLSRTEVLPMDTINI